MADLPKWTVHLSSIARLPKDAREGPRLRLTFVVPEHNPPQEHVIDVPLSQGDPQVRGVDEEDAVRMARHYLAKRFEALHLLTGSWVLPEDELKAIWNVPVKET